MRKQMTTLLCTVIIGGLYPQGTRATPASGFTATTLALGRLADSDVFNHSVLSPPDGGPSPLWLSLQKIKGLSDLYVQSNSWVPGGTTGWHTHPGHSLIIVTAGTLTVYEAHRSGCEPTVYTEGMAFVDHGGQHAHVIRNEGNVEARTIAVQLIPAQATRRIDADAPSGCTVQ